MLTTTYTKCCVWLYGVHLSLPDGLFASSFPIKILYVFFVFFISPCVPNNHIEQMVFKLSGACYAVRSMVHISNINTLKSIYCTYFHSVVKY